MDKRQKDIVFLNPLKGVARNRMGVFGFDVETVHRKEEYHGKEYLRQEFLMGSVVGPRTERVFWDKDKMCDYLLSRETRGSMMAATNLEFDFNALFSHRLSDFSLVYNNRLIAAIHKENINGKDRKWVMTDTMNYLPRNLETLGKIVGIPKADKPATMEKDPVWDIFSRPPENADERREIIDYNLNDSRITQAFTMSFRDFCTAHNMRMKLTVASTGMDYWRRNHQPWVMFREPVDILKLHFEGAFRGGRTEVFRRGTYDKRLWYYDYRSSYPGVMDKGADGDGAYPDPSSWHRCKHPTSRMIEEYEGICRADVKAPYMKIPPLGVRSGGKLLFPIGDFSGWFTNHELKICLEHGYEISPKDMIYYTRTFAPFRDAVRYLFKLRQKYKLEKHTYEAMVKLIMNSGLFGKWGMNWQNMQELVPISRVSFDSRGRCLIDGSLTDDVSISPITQGFDGFAVRRHCSDPPRYSFPILSTYTTMLGRMKLWKDIYRHHDSLVYTDTDSAVMTSPVLEEGSNLGDWELERVTEGGIFIRPKLYMLRMQDHVISKSKGLKDISYDKEKDCTDENCFIRSITRGHAEYNRFTRMKESQRMGVMSGSVMRMKKCIGIEDDKRRWPGMFDIGGWQDSEPIRMVEGMIPSVHEDMRRKAMDEYRKDYRRKQRAFIDSDLFDKASVGSDITSEEFLANEKDYAME